MAALVRIGLGLLLTLAPALCCCQARWLTAGASAGVSPCCQPVAPAPKPKPKPSVGGCPHCAPEVHAPEPASPPLPAAPKPDSRYPHCQFCDGQASAITADPQPRIEPPAFAGEFFPASALFATVAPVHPAFQAGVFPSERTGVDARSAALFARHVMRC